MIPETKLTRDELLAELQAQAARDRRAVKIIGEAALKAGKVMRGEEEPGGD